MPARWTARPLEVLDMERLTIEEELVRVEGTPAGLARFKGAVSLFRAAQAERQRHPGSQSEWNALWERIRARQVDSWPDAYCLPFAQLNLTPDQWRDLAERYHQLSLTAAALSWVEEQLPEEGSTWLGRDALSVLEACGAALSRLWRWSGQHLNGRRDDQQQEFYDRLRGWAAEHRIFLRSLQPEDLVTDAELDAVAADLETRLRELREAAAKRHRKAAALVAFARLVQEPDWGAREGDDQRTCDLAAACVEAGVPATDKGLRDPLVETPWIIEEDERLVKLRAAVTQERTRRQGAEEPEPAPGEKLPPEMEAMLQAVLCHTRGKRAVIVGGRCREDNRVAIKAKLELAELRWPSTDPSDTFERSRQEIKKADLVFLTRFNRRKSREAYALCNRDGKTLVVLPKGYSLSEVVFRSFRRLETPAGA